MSDDTDLEWIDTTGGPLIAMPLAAVGLWSGCEPPTDGRVIEASFRCGLIEEPATDYDRACSVGEDIGAIAVDRTWALVLTGMPPVACYIPQVDGGIFAVCECAESDEDLAVCLRDPPQTGWRETGVTISHEGGLVQLFDSATPGHLSERDPDDYMILSLQSGSYSISSNEWKPDAHTSLVLHRLTRVVP